MADSRSLLERNQVVSFGRRVTQLSTEHPEKVALTFSPAKGPDHSLNWQELERSSNRMARALERRGIDDESRVVVGLQNSLDHFLVTIGSWKLGACPIPVSWRLPRWERNRILEVVEAEVVVGEWRDLGPSIVAPEALLRAAEGESDDPLPDRIPHPGRAVLSGGSTGRPKIIVDTQPLARVPGELVAANSTISGMKSGQVQLVAGPLYHNAPFSLSHYGLFEDHSLVVMERFDAGRAVELIEKHRVNFAFMVPTMMQRIAQLPDIKSADFSSVDSIFHSGSSCPQWVKRAWIELIGAERIYEIFGSTEGVGFCVVRGDEWLEHPGSVGRPRETDLKILDEQGEVPPGQVGEIFMRLKNAIGPTYYYLGSPPAETTEDGFTSVGDLGWRDEEGYLFIADRRLDMIVTGGANVYPAEVEAALTEHAQIRDVVVIGVPDDEWGTRVHAIIQPRDPQLLPSTEELDVHCRNRLVPYKVPKSYEFMEELPRDDMGKIRRSQLANERSVP